jgi:hypothetical protein
VPRAQVADSDSDDLRRPVWTQRRVRRRELVHHVLSTKAGVHQAWQVADKRYLSETTLALLKPRDKPELVGSGTRDVVYP